MKTGIDHEVTQEIEIPSEIGGMPVKPGERAVETVEHAVRNPGGESPRIASRGGEPHRRQPYRERQERDQQRGTARSDRSCDGGEQPILDAAQQIVKHPPA
jgi:hypothetical protein